MEGFNSIQLEQIETIIRKVINEKLNQIDQNHLRIFLLKKKKKRNITQEEDNYIDSLVYKFFYGIR